jgi:AGCS family alanine or glycine:cation symporter
MAAESFGWDTTWIGLVLAILIGSVVIFGVKGIARVCELLVPFMAVFYVAGCIVLLIHHGQYIGEAIAVILKSAFSAQAATGGFIGSTIMLSMRYGIARGLFSNEAGLGSAPIVAAAAKTKNPVRQALVSSTSVFWDTVIICALTGLVLVTTILADNGVDSSASATLTRQAFEQIPIAFAGFNVGGVLLSIAIFTFAFSTILGWSYYGEKALEYLCGKYGKVGRYIFRVLITIGTYFGATNALEAVWNFGDAANALMAIPNLICLLVLSGVLVKETRYYLWEGRLDEEAKDQNSTN